MLKEQRGYVMVGLVIGIFAISSGILYLNTLTRSMVRNKLNIAASQNMRRINFVKTLIIITAEDVDLDLLYEPLAAQEDNRLPENLSISSTDPYGTEYRYCPFDLGTRNMVNFDFVSGTSEYDERLISAKIISAGPDKRFSTLCTEEDADDDDLMVVITEPDYRHNKGKSYGGWIDRGDIITLTNYPDIVGVDVYPDEKMDVNGSVRTRNGIFKDGEGKRRLEMPNNERTYFNDSEEIPRRQIHEYGTISLGNKEITGMLGVDREPHYRVDVDGSIKMEKRIYNLEDKKRLDMEHNASIILYDQHERDRFNLSWEKILTEHIDMRGSVMKNVNFPEHKFDMVNKSYVDSQGIGGRTTWVGYTSSVHHADFDGIEGMNNQCAAEYYESHACTYDEILSLGDQYPYERYTFIIDGSFHEMDEKKCYNISKTGQAISTSELPDYFLCNGWTSSSFQAKTAPVMGPDGLIKFHYCRDRFQVPCCK